MRLCVHILMAAFVSRADTELTEAIVTEPAGCEERRGRASRGRVSEPRAGERAVGG